MSNPAWIVYVRARYSVAEGWIWEKRRACSFSDVADTVTWCKSHGLRYRVAFDPRGCIY